MPQAWVVSVRLGLGERRRMAGFWHGKLKRKELEEVYDDFAEFSLSSPARKIRRLDAELPPIMEEVEPTSTLSFNQQFPQETISASVSSMPNLGSVVSQAMPTRPSNNDQRALVLYKPVEMPLLLSPSPTNVSIKFNSGFIDGLKSHMFKPRITNFDEKDKHTDADESCLAVIPWVPSQLASDSGGFEGSESQNNLSGEVMESEDANVTSMEIEDGNIRGLATTGGVGNENFQQQQQHCMTAQLTPNTSNSIMWSW
ncbi:hypothetical protein Cni_G28584 [Canna indica]|uniref:Uncharacterized protein n=1 Tax=Canna indica TaxID=4628 RepID=A0AAQ3L2S4_9LILI|nr:hypothetical protein Cni_G28584 [Canna indica]